MSEALWNAYVHLENDLVRGAETPRLLTDLIALVRHAINPTTPLAPYSEAVQQRYTAWLEQQEATRHTFSIELHDLGHGEFQKRGGRIAAIRVFEQHKLPAAALYGVVGAAGGHQAHLQCGAALVA